MLRIVRVRFFAFAAVGDQPPALQGDRAASNKVNPFEREAAYPVNAIASMKSQNPLVRTLSPALVSLLLVAGAVSPAAGQTDDENKATVEATVTLGPLITYIQPGPQPIAVVAAGTDVTLVAMKDPPAGAMVEWISPKGPIVETSNRLELGVVNEAGIHSYQAYVVATDGSRISRAVDLHVVDLPRRSRLANLSTRVHVTPDAPVVICGFNLDDAPKPDWVAPRRLLIRAVGPTLADFGVSQPLADPKLEIFLADGTPYEWPVEIAVVDPSRDPAALAVLVGAFPLREGATDFAAAPALPPGGYTLHISSASGGEGDVLVEVYEIPGI